MQIAAAWLRAQPLTDRRRRLFAGAAEHGPPLAIASVEQQHGIARLAAQDVDQMIGRPRRKRQFPPGRQGLVDIDAGGAEFDARHGLWRLKAGLTAAAKHPSAAFPTHSEACYKPLAGFAIW